MSVEWIESFSWLANGETSTALQNLLRERYRGSSDANGANMTAGTNDGVVESSHPGPGNSLKFSDAANNSFIWLKLPSDPNEVYLSMRCKLVGTLQNTPTFIQFLSNSSDLQCFGLDVTDDWIWKAIVQSSSISGIFSPQDWHPREWFTVEVYLKVDNAPDGAWEIRLNGTPIGSGSGIDTRPIGAGAFVNTIRIRSMNTGGDEGMLVRDLIINSGSGTVNNTWIGEYKHAYLILPNADTADEDWTRSAGADSFALIDEVSNDGGTTYLESGTSTEKTLCEYESSGGESNVDCVSIHTTAALDSAGSETFDDVLAEGATETNSTAHTVDDTAYKMFTTAYDQNPDTAADWDSSELDAVQGGVHYN